MSRISSVSFFIFVMAALFFVQPKNVQTLVCEKCCQPYDDKPITCEENSCCYNMSTPDLYNGEVAYQRGCRLKNNLFPYANNLKINECGKFNIANIRVRLCYCETDNCNKADFIIIPPGISPGPPDPDKTPTTISAINATTISGIKATTIPSHSATQCLNPIVFISTLFAFYKI